MLARTDNIDDVVVVRWIGTCDMLLLLRDEILDFCSRVKIAFMFGNWFESRGCLQVIGDGVAFLSRLRPWITY